MLVSFIIPVFNREKKIIKCLNSLMKLEREDIEFIIVDDGSNDRTVEIIEELQARDDRINLLKMNHQGVSKARNVGIENSKGEYIIFVDSDDYVYPSELEKTIELVNSNDNLTIYGFIKNDSEDNKLDDLVLENKEYTTSRFLEYLALNNFNRYVLNPVWNKVYKRSILLDYNIRFDERFHYGEDMIFNLDYLKQCSSIKLIDTTVYCYIIDLNSSISTSYCEDYSYNIKGTLDSLLSLYQSFKLDTKYKDQLFKYFKARIDRVIRHRNDYLKDQETLNTVLSEDRKILEKYITLIN